MYKLNSNRDGTFSLIYSKPPIVVLKRININFPEVTSNTGGAPHIIPGPAEVTVTIEHEDGKEETINNVPVEW